jgi:riboflavin biosynthesis pyrimidine reductase
LIDFVAYSRRKTATAASATISGFRTVEERAVTRELVRVGNDFSRAIFDGWFYRSKSTRQLPALSLVFVQSRDGNTGADDPAALGGGAIDKHLIYEGLSRVDAHAVIAGATTARGDEILFSVWHPELAKLRQELGHPRHPAQVVITSTGNLPIENGLMFNEPSLRVLIVTGSAGAAVLRGRVRQRSSVELVDVGPRIALKPAMQQLYARGLHVISCIGGRRTAAELLNDELVDDLYLTTGRVRGGNPKTPLYEGSPRHSELVLEKQGIGSDEGVQFQHFRFTRKSELGTSDG